MSNTIRPEPCCFGCKQPCVPEALTLCDDRMLCNFCLSREPGTSHFAAMKVNSREVHIAARNPQGEFQIHYKDGELNMMVRRS